MQLLYLHLCTYDVIYVAAKVLKFIDAKIKFNNINKIVHTGGYIHRRRSSVNFGEFARKLCMKN